MWYIDVNTSIPRFVAEEVHLEKGCAIRFSSLESYVQTPDGFAMPTISRTLGTDGKEIIFHIDTVQVGVSN